MNPCLKGHPHNTIEGMKRCNLKYADKRVARIVARGPIIYRKIVHRPAKIVDKGFIRVYIYQEAEVLR
jgi:hypothetical protein